MLNNPCSGKLPMAKDILISKNKDTQEVKVFGHKIIEKIVKIVLI